MFPKKILTRGTFVCVIDDISCRQSRPQIGYCCACCKVLKIARPAAPKITRIASSANKSGRVAVAENDKDHVTCTMEPLLQLVEMD